MGVARACAAFGVKPRTYRYRQAQAQRATGRSAEPLNAPLAATAAAEPAATPGVGSAAAQAASEAITHDAPQAGAARARKPHPAALTAGERPLILDTLCSETYYDLPPAQVFNTLLDAGTYLCSVRQMYRLLAEHGLSNERRRGGHQRRGLHAEPVVHATGPNQAWSWDITKLKGPQSGVLYYLYTILDIYTRYVVGWAVHARESKELATHLIRKSAERAACLRLVTALCVEQSEEWLSGRRYLDMSLLVGHEAAVSSVASAPEETEVGMAA